MKTCSKCGRALDAGARFCGGCGTQVEGAPLPQAVVRSNAKTVLVGSGVRGADSAPSWPKPATDTSTVQLRPRVGTAPSSPLDDAPSPGQVLNGRFRVLEKIGDGGFGAVYRGEQIQMGRECALKILHADMARDAQVVGRFRREAQAASILKAPHTVQIYDFDSTPEGVLYLAMELLHGRSLQSLMQGQAMDAARVVHVLAQTAESLGEAHAQGIIHRDIKPENIVLETRGDDPDYVKVLDFGIAKIVSGERGRGPALTVVGQTLGTLEYMSPEQLMGLTLDGRSDLYALGVMGYEMLTGQLPFEGKNSEEMINAHFGAVPTAPSKLVPQGGIPPLLDEIILRLLKKDREERYRDAADLNKDLTRVDVKPGPPGVVAPSDAPTAPPPVTPRRDPEAAKPTMAVRAAASQGMSPAMTLTIALVVTAVVSVAAWFLLLRDAEGAEPDRPPPARLVPSGLSALVAIDFEALRAASPPAAAASLEEMLSAPLGDVGGKRGKLSHTAIGFDLDTLAEAKGKHPSVVILDAPFDRGKLEKTLAKQLPHGAKFAGASYRGLRFRRSGSIEYVSLPGDRWVVTRDVALAKSVDLSRGTGQALVDSEAKELLAAVGASGGSGPAFLAWARFADVAKRGLLEVFPGGALASEGAAAFTADGTGASLQLIARCKGDRDAQQLAEATRQLVERGRKDPAILMLGLASLLSDVKVSTTGPNVTASLRLSPTQYGDLVTRLAGIAAAAIDQSSPASRRLESLPRPR